MKNIKNKVVVVFIILATLIVTVANSKNRSIFKVGDTLDVVYTIDNHSDVALGELNVSVDDLKMYYINTVTRKSATCYIDYKAKDQLIKALEKAVKWDKTAREKKLQIIKAVDSYYQDRGDDHYHGWNLSYSSMINETTDFQITFVILTISDFSVKQKQNVVMIDIKTAKQLIDILREADEMIDKIIENSEYFR